MNADNIIRNIQGDVFGSLDLKGKPVSEAAIETITRALKAKAEAAFGFEVSVGVIRDDDTKTLLYTLHNNGQRLFEQRAVPYASINSRAGAPKKRERNPAPETGPAKKPQAD